MVRTCQPPGKLWEDLLFALVILSADDIAELSIRDVQHTVRSPGKRMSYGAAPCPAALRGINLPSRGIQVIAGNAIWADERHE
jgi:hypothetical protein